MCPPAVLTAESVTGPYYARGLPGMLYVRRARRGPYRSVGVPSLAAKCCAIPVRCPRCHERVVYLKLLFQRP